MTGGKHTPGPWRIGQFGLTNDGESPILSDHADVLICAVTCQTPFKRGKGWRTECETREANARLIAAAPEMLEALESAESCIVTFVAVNGWPEPNGSRDILNEVQAAIARAKGGEP
jgi:hypothetical protein